MFSIDRRLKCVNVRLLGDGSLRLSSFAYRNRHHVRLAGGQKRREEIHSVHRLFSNSGYLLCSYPLFANVSSEILSKTQIQFS